jgi:conjugal transfer pilin signal peptidase TrbI
MAISSSEIVVNQENASSRFWTARRRGLYAGYAILAFLFLALSSLSAWRERHMVMINVSPSLPNWAFIVDVGQVPKRDDYIVFDMPLTPLVRSVFGSDPHPWVKFAYGVAGDSVTVTDRISSINGKVVGRAKEKSKKGVILHPTHSAIIPNGCYYVGTPHIDGFDSRYAEVGLICAHRIIGTARPVL